MRIARFAAIIAWSMLVFLFGIAPAAADKRVALVIGNGGYENVGKLTNPTNDARAIATMLRDVGFETVELHKDIGIRELRRAIGNFSDVARNADVAIVYYAGHGIEVEGVNYLIPVDAVLERDVDVPYEAFSLDNLLKVLEPVKRLRVVILDACRDNPFIRSMKRSISTRAVGRGLAAVDPTSANTLIGFAAKGGSTAADGDGANSPYAAALLAHIATPGLDLRIAFGRVRDEVLKNTKNRQEPFVYGSLGGDNMPLVDAPPAPNVGTSSASGTVNLQSSNRIALVIGNGDYKKVPQLPNPTNDAKLVARELEQRGFKVIMELNADRATMIRAITDFENTLSIVGGTGVFYYAGQAAFIEGEDIMGPVDIETDTSQSKLIGGVNLTQLMKEVGARTTQKYNNNGLAIIYAASKGEVVSDGAGANSPFTTAFVEALKNTDFELGDLYREIRAKLQGQQNANDKIIKQTPYFEDSRSVKFHFNKPEQDAKTGVLKILILDSCRDNPFKLSADTK